MVIYNLTNQIIGTCVKGRHFVIPASGGNTIGHATCSEKEAEILIKMYPKALTKNYDDAKGGGDAKRNLEFQQENVSLKKQLDAIAAERDGLKAELEKTQKQLSEFKIRNENLETEMKELADSKESKKK